MAEKLENRTRADEIAAALTARGISVAAVDAAYNLVWVGANSVVAGLITGYEGCKPDTFAIIDRFGASYGGNDHGHTLAEAVTTVAAYVRDGRTYQTRMSTNVLVDDGRGDDLRWNTTELNNGIDDLLKAEADNLRDDAFRGDFDYMKWENAEVYARIAPENDLVELARAPVFEDAEGPESYGAKRTRALESDLNAEVVLSARAIRSEAGLDPDEEIDGVLDAVETAVETWANGENCLGVGIFNQEVGVADEDSDCGELHIAVSCEREIFRNDAAKLRDDLEEVVSEAIARAFADLG